MSGEASARPRPTAPAHDLPPVARTGKSAAAEMG